MKIKKFQRRIVKIIKNRRIPLDNYENHENHKIPLESHENHENLRIP